MSYSPVPTVVTGDTWTASQHNTYIRDNFAALHPYTTRGDIAYLNSTGILARRALGAETLCLKSYGGDPTYMGAIGFHVYRNGHQTINDNTVTTLTFDTELFDTYNMIASNTFTVPTGWSGLWLIGAGGYFSGKAENNGGLREIGLTGASAADPQTASFTQDMSGSAIHVNVVMIRYFVDDTVTVKVLQKSGGALEFYYANFWGCKLA